MARTRNKAEIDRDRKEIGDLYLQGWKQQDIADRLGINQSTVSRDIKTLLKGWEKDAAKSIATLKGQQKEQLEYLYKEAVEAWLDSRSDAITETEETIITENDGSEGKRAKITKTTKGQSGNPAFLAQARQLKADIRAMFGIDIEPGDEERPIVVKMIKGVSMDDL